MRIPWRYLIIAIIVIIPSLVQAGAGGPGGNETTVIPIDNVNNVDQKQTTNIGVSTVTGPTTTTASGGDQEQIQRQHQGQEQQQGQNQGQEQTTISAVRDSGNSSSSSKGGDQNQGQEQKVEKSGNSTVQNVGNVNITYPKQRPSLPAPGIVAPSNSSPPLFQQYGLPANAKGDSFVVRISRLCPSVYTSGAEMTEKRESGASDLTNIVFSPYASYTQLGNRKPVARAEIVEISTDIVPGKRLLVLGILQVEAEAKKSPVVSRSTIFTDTLQFTKSMEGFQNIKFVYLPSALSVNVGNDGSSRGVGASPGASGIIGTTLLTLGLGGSANWGQTYQAAQLGGTFLVVAEGDYPASAPHIDLAELVKPELDQIAAAKSEATQAQEEAARAQALSDKLVAEKAAQEKMEAVQRAAAQEKNRLAQLTELEKARADAAQAKADAEKALATLADAQKAQAEKKSVVATPAPKPKPKAKPPTKECDKKK